MATGARNGTERKQLSSEKPDRDPPDDRRLSIICRSRGRMVPYPTPTVPSFQEIPVGGHASAPIAHSLFHPARLLG